MNLFDRNNNFERRQENYKFDVNDFLSKVLERLNKMEPQIVVIDRFEGNVAICEDRKTKEMFEVNKNDLPANAKEGTILKFLNGKYEIDTSGRIEKRIKDKMDKLWE